MKTLSLGLLLLCGMASGASRCPIDVGSSVWGPSGSRPSTDLSGIISYHGFVPGTATTSWRQDIRSAPVDPQSAVWLADMQAAGGTISPPDYVALFDNGWEGFVAHFVDGSTQRRMIVRDNPPPREGYAGETDPGTFPLPQDIIVEGFKGKGSRPWGFNLDLVDHGISDQQSFVIDTKDCIVYELWRVFKDGSNISAGTYAAFDMLAGDLQRPIGKTSNSVSGMQSWSTVLRREEFNAGVINHALEITVYGSNTTAYAFPASHSQCCGGWHPEHIPFGAKIRLKDTYVRDSNIPAGCQPIIDALKKYGAVNKDGGRTGDMYGETNWLDFSPCRAIYPRTYLGINPDDWDVIDTGTVYCPGGEYQEGVAHFTNGSTAVTWVSGDKFWEGFPGSGHLLTVPGVTDYGVAAVSGCSGGFCTGATLTAPHTGATGDATATWAHGGIHCTSTLPTGDPPVINSFTATGHTLHWSVSGVVDGDDNPVRLRNISTGISNPAVACTHMDQTDDGNRCKLGPGWIAGPDHGESVIVDPGGVSRVYTLMVQNRFGRTYANVTVLP